MSVLRAILQASKKEQEKCYQQFEEDIIYHTFLEKVHNIPSMKAEKILGEKKCPLSEVTSFNL